MKNTFKTSKEITHAAMSEFLDYCASSGAITWKKAKARAKAGEQAGNHSVANGYLWIGVFGHVISAHRIAWLLAKGSWPLGSIDHIDGDRTNNRIANLRELSNKENCENRRGAQRNNAVGLLGVSRAGKKFAATIRHNGKQHWIGRYDTPEEAHCAYLERKRAAHAGCTI